MELVHAVTKEGARRKTYEKARTSLSLKSLDKKGRKKLTMGWESRFRQANDPTKRYHHVQKEPASAMAIRDSGKFQTTSRPASLMNQLPGSNKDTPSSIFKRVSSNHEPVVVPRKRETLKKSPASRHSKTSSWLSNIFNKPQHMQPKAPTYTNETGQEDEEIEQIENPIEDSNFAGFPGGRRDSLSRSESFRDLQRLSLLSTKTSESKNSRPGSSSSSTSSVLPRNSFALRRTSSQKSNKSSKSAKSLKNAASVSGVFRRRKKSSPMLVSRPIIKGPTLHLGEASAGESLSYADLGKNQRKPPPPPSNQAPLRSASHKFSVASHNRTSSISANMPAIHRSSSMVRMSKFSENFQFMSDLSPRLDDPSFTLFGAGAQEMTIDVSRRSSPDLSDELASDASESDSVTGVANADNSSGISSPAKSLVSAGSKISPFKAPKSGSWRTDTSQVDVGSVGTPKSTRSMQTHDSGIVSAAASLSENSLVSKNSIRSQPLGLGIINAGSAMHLEEKEMLPHRRVGSPHSTSSARSLKRMGSENLEENTRYFEKAAVDPLSMKNLLSILKDPHTSKEDALAILTKSAHGHASEEVDVERETLRDGSPRPPSKATLQMPLLDQFLVNKEPPNPRPPSKSLSNLQPPAKSLPAPPRPPRPGTIDASFLESQDLSLIPQDDAQNEDIEESKEQESQVSMTEEGEVHESELRESTTREVAPHDAFVEHIRARTVTSDSDESCKSFENSFESSERSLSPHDDMDTTVSSGPNEPKPHKQNYEELQRSLSLLLKQGTGLDDSSILTNSSYYGLSPESRRSAKQSTSRFDDVYSPLISSQKETRIAPTETRSDIEGEGEERAAELSSHEQADSSSQELLQHTEVSRYEPVVENRPQSRKEFSRQPSPQNKNIFEWRDVPDHMNSAIDSDADTEGESDSEHNDIHNYELLSKVKSSHSAQFTQAVKMSEPQRETTRSIEPPSLLESNENFAQLKKLLPQMSKGSGFAEDAYGRLQDAARSYAESAARFAEEQAKAYRLLAEKQSQNVTDKGVHFQTEAGEPQEKHGPDVPSLGRAGRGPSTSPPIASNVGKEQDVVSFGPHFSETQHRITHRKAQSWDGTSRKTDIVMRDEEASQGDPFEGISFEKSSMAGFVFCDHCQQGVMAQLLTATIQKDCESYKMPVKLGCGRQRRQGSNKGGRYIDLGGTKGEQVPIIFDIDV